MYSAIRVVFCWLVSSGCDAVRWATYVCVYQSVQFWSWSCCSLLRAYDAAKSVWEQIIHNTIKACYFTTYICTCTSDVLVHVQCTCRQLLWNISWRTSLSFETLNPAAPTTLSPYSHFFLRKQNDDASHSMACVFFVKFFAMCKLPVLLTGALISRKVQQATFYKRWGQAGVTEAENSGWQKGSACSWWLLVPVVELSHFPFITPFVLLEVKTTISQLYLHDLNQDWQWYME